MEPIPESVEAAAMLRPFTTSPDLLGPLTRSAELVQGFVPSLYGVSLGALEGGVSFTVVASSAEVAALDGVQYLNGGPCVDGGNQDRVRTYHAGDPTNEAAWALFARSAAAHGIASTLTLPITDLDRVTGSVNLFASSAQAFDSHHTIIAAIFGAWAAGAVSNANLGLDTLRVSQRAPEVLRAQDIINQAVGILTVRRNVNPEVARDSIADAATRAGVEDVEIARLVVEFHEPDTDGPTDS